MDEAINGPSTQAIIDPAYHSRWKCSTSAFQVDRRSRGVFGGSATVCVHNNSMATITGVIICGYIITVGVVVVERRRVRFYDAVLLSVLSTSTAFLSMLWQLHVRAYSIRDCASRSIASQRASQRASHLCQAAEAPLQVSFHVPVLVQAFDNGLCMSTKIAVLEYSCMNRTPAPCFSR